MEFRKTVACCVAMLWVQLWIDILLIHHVLGARVQQEQTYGLGHVQTFALLTALGTTENFTTQIANLTDKSVLAKTQLSTLHSLCSSIGSLWIEYAEPNFQNRRQGASSVKPYYADNDLSCRPLGSGERLPGSVKYVGNSRLNRPGLSFFSEESFDGEELYFEGSRLMYTFYFRSYGFTGPNSWAVYSGGNFTGESLCLEKRFDMAITMNEKAGFGIGSVRIGCHQQNWNSETEDDDGPVPALILYYNHLQGGNLQTLQLYFDGNELRLPFSRSFHAYSIVGPPPPEIVPPVIVLDPSLLNVTTNATADAEYAHEVDPRNRVPFDDSWELSWTIYSGINFDGHSKCLTSGKAVIGATNQFKEYNNRHDIHLMIGSIRFGCDKVVNMYNMSKMRNQAMPRCRGYCCTSSVVYYAFLIFVLLMPFEGIK